MSENLFISQALTDEEKYITLLSQADALLDDNYANVTNLANFAAMLKQTFDKISWVGFYLAKHDNLFLGPFQGKVACTSIRIGNGVCGLSAKERKTVIVPDVNQFPGHIMCDPESRSEIVVPLIKDNELYGVLDLDSTALNSFNETDKIFLEKLSNILLKKLI